MDSTSRSNSRNRQSESERIKREHTQDSLDINEQNRGHSTKKKPLNVFESTRKLSQETAKEQTIQQTDTNLSIHTNKKEAIKELTLLYKQIKALDHQFDTLEDDNASPQEQQLIQKSNDLIKRTNILANQLNPKEHHLKNIETQSAAPSDLSERDRFLWDMKKMSLEAEAIYKTIEEIDENRSENYSQLSDRVAITKDMVNKVLGIKDTFETIMDEQPYEKVFKDWIYQWPGPEEIKVKMFETFGPKPTETAEDIFLRHKEETLQLKNDIMNEDLVLLDNIILGTSHTDKGNIIKIYDWTDKALTGPITQLQEKEYMARHLSDEEELGEVELLYPADITFNSHRLTFSDGPDDPVGHIDNNDAIKILKDNNFRIIGTSPFLNLRGSDLYEIPKGGSRGEWEDYKIEDVVMFLDDKGKIKYSGFISSIDTDTNFPYVISKKDPYGVYRGYINALEDKWVVLQTKREKGRRLHISGDLQEATPTLSEPKLTELYLKMRTGTYTKEDIISPINDDIASMFSRPDRGEESFKPHILQD